MEKLPLHSMLRTLSLRANFGWVCSDARPRQATPRHEQGRANRDGMETKSGIHTYEGIGRGGRMEAPEDQQQAIARYTLI